MQNQDKIAQYEEQVIQSKQYQDQIKFLDTITSDTIQTIGTIALYSTRAKHIYDDCLTIRCFDDLLQSVLGIRDLVKSGIHNMTKREIRYLLEMTTKYLIVDQEKMGEPLGVKAQYLKDNILNSSINVITRLVTPFNAKLDRQLKSEVCKIFYESCAYVHPSKEQLDEQIANYSQGIYSGFETAEMLAKVNKLLFRTYDIILTMLFTGFGQSMSGDIIVGIYDDIPKWKFHKGRYIKEFSKFYDYKHERQSKKK